MSREKMFTAIRSALGGNESARRKAAEARLAAPPQHPRPERASRPRAELLADFRSRLEKATAVVLPVAGEREVPGAVAAVLASLQLPRRVRAGEGSLLARFEAPGLVVETGPASHEDTAGFSRALAGIAETGTLVIASGPDNPTSLAYLPETHIVAVPEESIAGSMEDAFAHLRTRFGRPGMPRTLSMISGPSRTGDIGGRIVLGAHGPRRLVVVVMGGN